MSNPITTFYKGHQDVNRAHYGTSANPSTVALPARAALARREWSQPINFADGTAEVPEQFTFPATCIVTAASVYVRTAETTGTTKQINVGTATADSGTPNAFLNGIDVSTTGLKTASNGQPIAITVTASPFAYTAIGAQYVTITGGTTSAITLTRNGVTTANIGTTTPVSVYLGDGDIVTVTYSVAPTMKAFPSNDPEFLTTSVGGKRLSWTPASNNFATLDADILIEYLVLNDLTLPEYQNTNVIMGPSD
jgi:hypothetical protein